jgi:alkanesulfonate monooxygenase SsuD/methylene tetrahydromethanopterin reductase-like flavin-dependent oxidoreductase (luciferase family)
MRACDVVGRQRGRYTVIVDGRKQGACNDQRNVCVSRFDEALRIIVPLLREGRVDFQGTYYRADQCGLRRSP